MILFYTVCKQLCSRFSIILEALWKIHKKGFLEHSLNALFCRDRHLRTFLTFISRNWLLTIFGNMERFLKVERFLKFGRTPRSNFRPPWNVMWVCMREKLTFSPQNTTWSRGLIQPQSRQRYLAWDKYFYLDWDKYLYLANISKINL